MLRIRSVLFLLLYALAFSAQAGPSTLLVLGDSLSAGYGLNDGEGWVSLMQRRLAAGPRHWDVINASVSGETSAGGLARLPDLLDKYHPAVVLIELGANDGLRALSIDAMKTNLTAMVTRSQRAGARVAVFEMRIPSNYGPAYTTGFTQAFTDVTSDAHATLIPFFLAPIALQPDQWFQSDGIHPNAKAQPLILGAVWPTIQMLLQATPEKSGSGH